MLEVAYWISCLSGIMSFVNLWAFNEMRKERKVDGAFFILFINEGIILLCSNLCQLSIKPIPIQPILLPQIIFSGLFLVLTLCAWTYFHMKGFLHYGRQKVLIMLAFLWCLIALAVTFALYDNTENAMNAIMHVLVITMGVLSAGKFFILARGKGQAKGMGKIFITCQLIYWTALGVYLAINEETVWLVVDAFICVLNLIAISYTLSQAIRPASSLEKPLQSQKPEMQPENLIHKSGKSIATTTVDSNDSLPVD